MFIKPLELSIFKTSGSEMFANIPKNHWQRYYPCSENNLCTWSLRSLYINEGPISLLIDTGFGNIEEKILEEYHVKPFRNVRDLLVPSDIFPVSHILLTHLHLDHCGGLLHMHHSSIDNVFAASKIITGNEQLKVALHPSAAEELSFQNVVVKAISNSAKLTLIEKDCFLFPWLELLLFNGHTKGMIVPVIHQANYSVAFVSDLIPSIAHLILDCTMIYDVNPVLSMAERQEFLKEAYENEYILFFQHDFYHECCTLKKDGSKFMPDKLFKAEEIF